MTCSLVLASLPFHSLFSFQFSDFPFLLSTSNSANPERVRLFHSKEQDGFPFSPLLKCLEREDEYIMQKANKVLTGIIW